MDRQRPENRGARPAIIVERHARGCRGCRARPPGQPACWIARARASTMAAAPGTHASGIRFHATRTNMNHNNDFARFIPAIRALDPATLRGPADIPANFLLGQDGALTSQYTPFDYTNTAARVVLVGITPGFTQWRNAVLEAQRQLAAGAPAELAHRAAKLTGAFSGTMRPNLIALLDHIGLNRWLGLASCEALFGPAAALVQTTSILRHAVFVGEKNYNGTPNMVRHAFLSQQIDTYFATEARALSEAVFVPMGPQVTEALDWLAGRGVIREQRILRGLPHPSGANAERIAYFLGRKARATLSTKTNADKLDALKHELEARVAALG